MPTKTIDDVIFGGILQPNSQEVIQFKDGCKKGNCPNPGCSHRHSKKSMKTHLEVCKYRSVKCVICNFEGSLQESERHACLKDRLIEQLFSHNKSLEFNLFQANHELENLKVKDDTFKTFNTQKSFDEKDPNFLSQFCDTKNELYQSLEENKNLKSKLSILESHLS